MQIRCDCSSSHRSGGLQPRVLDESSALLEETHGNRRNHHAGNSHAYSRWNDLSDSSDSSVAAQSSISAIFGFNRDSLNDFLLPLRNINRIIMLESIVRNHF